MSIQPPASIVRTTVGAYLMSDNQYSDAGVYIVACYPSLGAIYVGISDNVEVRIRQHLVLDDDPLGCMIRGFMADSVRWRLDILLPPDDNSIDVRQWLKDTEKALIRRLRPVVNTQHNSRID